MLKGPKASRSQRITVRAREEILAVGSGSVRFAK